MFLYSYTLLTIMHDQRIREALAGQRLYAEQDAQKHGLLQNISKVLARSFNRRNRKQEEPLPDCAY